MSDLATSQAAAPTSIHRAIDIVTSATIEIQRLQRRVATSADGGLDQDLARLEAMLARLGGLLIEIRQEYLGVAVAGSSAAYSAESERAGQDGRGRTFPTAP